MLDPYTGLPKTGRESSAESSEVLKDRGWRHQNKQSKPRV